MNFRGILIGLLMLLVAGCDQDEGVTPLMIAAKEGDTQSVIRLISEGSDLNDTSNYGWSALMFAAWQGHDEIVHILVDSGADINLRSAPVPAHFSTTGDYPKTTALTEAISNQHLPIANFLIDQGVNIDPASVAVAGAKAGPDLLRRMSEYGIDINAISDNEFNRTALSAAARHGNLENMKWLLANGADPNLDLPHTSNLNQAIRGLQPDAVELLIAAGADPNQIIGSRKTSALWEAIYTSVRESEHRKRIEIIEILLKSGADSNYRRNNYDRTMIEQIEHALEASEAGIQNAANNATAQRHHRSIEANLIIRDLLKSYQK